MVENFLTWRTVEVPIYEFLFLRKLFRQPFTKKIELIKVTGGALGFDKLHTRRAVFKRAEFFQLEPVPLEIQSPYKEQYQNDPDSSDRAIWAFGSNGHFDAFSLTRFTNGTWDFRFDGVLLNDYWLPEQSWVFARRQQ
jgi:hypothetical protein